jgi:uncharacterized protein (TIGR02171 family)
MQKIHCIANKSRLVFFAVFAIAISSAFFFFGCSDGSGALTEVYAGEGAGMILVRAAGHSVTLGTDAPTAPLSARPAMKASFTYDYSLSKREVTRGEYAALAGGSVPDSLKDLPRTDVTYYDAVLYANLRSAAEGLDTVYTYASLTRSADGSCASLEGLVTHLGRDGYRLPTEAEWTYAASPGWDPAGKAWTSDNSGYAAHAACSAGADASGFCDLAGNALEWTDDWLGNFRDTSVTDFAGAPDGGSVGERVVKGGSYRNASANTELYRRGDVYTVTGATKAAYVGFRLARGAVRSPAWLSASGATTSKTSVTAGASALRSLLGTYRAKLAFRDDATGNIGYVDWASGAASAREIADTLDCYHPDISPDGRRVAFCTRPEGVSGTSRVYVRDLDSAGTGLVRLDVASAAIPRWRVTGTDTSIVYVTDAGDDTDLPGWKTRSTWEVPFGGGKFGTPAKLLDGAFNAGVSRDGRLAVTGSKLLRANMNGRDALWYDGEQACNASLSRDSLKRTLFLDFGGGTGHAYAGTDYGAHGRMLVADSLGRLTATYPSPAGYTFDHTEWALGAPGFAVTGLADAEGAHTRLALVDLADSSVTELAEGDELWHPCLWVASTATTNMNLDPDSAGAYLVPNALAIHRINRVKMEEFWEMKDNVDVIALGSSRIEKGVDPLALSNHYALNMATPGFLDVDAMYYFAKNYAFNHVSNLKYLLIDLDIDGWIFNGTGLTTLYQELPGYIYDASHNFWAEGLPENFTTFVKTSFPATQDVIDIYTAHRGAAFEPQGKWGGSSPLISYDSLWAEHNPQILTQAESSLLSIITDSQIRGIKVIGIIFPQSPAYKETGAFGRYGLSRTKASEIIDWLNTLQQKYSNFILMDENKMGDHDYTDAMAFDYDHLSYLGAAQLTHRLDSLLNTLK